MFRAHYARAGADRINKSTCWSMCRHVPIKICRDVLGQAAYKALEDAHTTPLVHTGSRLNYPEEIQYCKHWLTSPHCMHILEYSRLFYILCFLNYWYLFINTFKIIPYCPNLSMIISTHIILTNCISTHSRMILESNQQKLVYFKFTIDPYQLWNFLWVWSR